VSAECGYVNKERLLTNTAIIGRHLTSSRCVWKWRTTY